MSEEEIIQELLKYTKCHELRGFNNGEMCMITNGHKMIINEIIKMIENLKISNKELDKECSRLERKEVEMQKEIELKDKIIEEMAVNISEAETFIAQNYGIYTEFDKADKEYIINTFTNKAKEYYAGFNINKVKENK